MNAYVHSKNETYVRTPTHRCKTCGAFWVEFMDSWSLFSGSCGWCCDNVAMGDQIEKLTPEASENARVLFGPGLFGPKYS